MNLNPELIGRYNPRAAKMREKITESEDRRKYKVMH